MIECDRQCFTGFFCSKTDSCDIYRTHKEAKYQVETIKSLQQQLNKQAQELEGMNEAKLSWCHSCPAKDMCCDTAKCMKYNRIAYESLNAKFKQLKQELETARKAEKLKDKMEER
jgi:hypothetical protein